MIEVPVQPGELEGTNNRLATFVTVRKGGLKVLYITGTRRKEAALIRRSLGASPDINVDVVYIDASAPNETKPPDFAGLLSPGQFDAYILGDIDAEAFDAETGELDTLAEAVSQGAGLIMLGGVQSFDPGGYHATKLAEVLPVTMDRLKRQAIGAPIDASVHVTRPLKMLPTPDGIRQRIMRLAPGDDNLTRWDEMPPLKNGANKFTALKPSAVVLAETPEKLPLLVGHNYGKGRVLAFAGDSTWCWQMGGFGAEHKRFWRQVILFLTRKEDAGDKLVWINLPRRRYEPGERVEFTAGAQTPESDAIADATFEAVVELPDGTSKDVFLTRQGEEVAGTIPSVELPGDYTLRVTANVDGSPYGETDSRFLVVDRNLELDQSSADRERLRELARITSEHGGAMRQPEELADILAEVRDRQIASEVPRQTKLPLYANWPVFLVLTGLLIVEWYLRKRWRLV